MNIQVLMTVAEDTLGSPCTLYLLYGNRVFFDAYWGHYSSVIFPHYLGKYLRLRTQPLLDSESVNYFQSRACALGPCGRSRVHGGKGARARALRAVSELRQGGGGKALQG